MICKCLGMTFDRPGIHNKNKRGPRIEPWGAPKEMSWFVGVWPKYLHLATSNLRWNLKVMQKPYCYSRNTYRAFQDNNNTRNIPILVINKIYYFLYISYFCYPLSQINFELSNRAIVLLRTRSALWNEIGSPLNKINPNYKIYLGKITGINDDLYHLLFL